jgi:hypothetical protein
MWQPKDVEFVFSSYSKYEERLLEFLKVFPYNEKNKEAWSPELVSLFLDVCGLIDSMSRYILSNGKFGNDVETEIVKKKGGKKKVKDLNIGDFKLNIFDKFEFEKYKVVLYIYSIYPDCIIIPYRYEYKKDIASLEWWDVYNGLKHNRLNNYEKANLENIIKSLSALFVFIMAYEHEEFTKGMLRRSWINTDWVPEAVHEERLKSPKLFWHETSLFGSGHALKEINLKSIEGIPMHCNSRKLSNFIGRYNR